MLSITLTPNRGSSPWGYTRVTRYEFKIWGDFEWDGGSGPIGASLVPVTVLKEFRGAKFQAVRVTQRPQPQGIWHREWPFIPRDERFVPRGVETHEPPEPEWLKEARLDAVSEAGNIRCGVCGMRRRGRDYGAICVCKPLDAAPGRDYIVAPREWTPEDRMDMPGTHDFVRHQDSPTNGRRSNNGRNDSRRAWDGEARPDFRAVEKAARERRRSAGSHKRKGEV